MIAISSKYFMFKIFMTKIVHTYTQLAKVVIYFRRVKLTKTADVN